MALAKGLRGGLPIGAVGANKKTSDVLSPGTHGSTFGGNFLAAGVAKVIINKLLKKGFLESVVSAGDDLMNGITKLSNDYDEIIMGVRGKGLMIGIECKIKNLDLFNSLREEGLLSVPAAGNIVRFLPPLNINHSHIERALEILEKSMIKLKDI